MKPKVLPKSALGKAVYYATEQWPAVLHYVDDGELAIATTLQSVRLSKSSSGARIGSC